MTEPIDELTAEGPHLCEHHGLNRSTQGGEVDVGVETGDGSSLLQTSVSREGLGLDHTAAIERVDSIAATTAELLAHVQEMQATPLQAVRSIAQARIRGAA